MSARRGAQFVPIGIPTICWKTFPAKTFMFKNGNRRYKYLVSGHEESYFEKEHSDSKHKYSEDDIIKMLEFLVDNIFVVLDVDQH